MAVNKHFHTSGYAAVTAEQNLYANLVSEAIQIYGHDVYYMDRTIVAEDTVLGLDHSKFEKQVPIEMYMEDTQGGYGGTQELMSQFGLQNLSEATFVVSKNRFQDKTKQITIESGTDTSSSGAIMVESGTLSTLDGGYIISEADVEDSDRPLEGDVIYHPILKKLFEINFVDHDEPFHQLDSNPVYKMKCRLWDYSSEQLDTGIAAIDAIEDAISTDTLGYQFTLEQTAAYNEKIKLNTYGDDYLIDETDSDNIIGEDDSSSIGENVLMESDFGHGGWGIQEDYILGTGGINTGSKDKSAQNELFDELDDTNLDFSEKNPFGDAGSA